MNRLSLENPVDFDDALMGLKKGSLLAITAPVAPSTAKYGGGRLQFGTALILGGIALRHPPLDSFLQKFSLVAEATRDIELGMGPLNIEHGLRRQLFNDTINLKADLVQMSLPRGSLNENLNMPLPRTLRKQLILEKIDNYNNSLPIQAHVLITLDINGAGEGQKSQNFWNPATAPLFVPTSFQYPPQFNSYTGPGPNGAMSPPPFMILPQGGFMDAYNFGGGYAPPPPPADESAVMDDKEENEGEMKEGEKSAPGGVGLNQSRQQQFTPVSYMFHPFNPYGMFPPALPSPPPPGVPVPPGAPGMVGASTPPPPAPPPAPKGQTATGKFANQGKKRNGKRNQSNSKQGPAHIYRLPLLEEVRANPKKDYQLKDIYGHAIEFTKDQHGLRFIQQKLPDATEEEKEMIFNEIREILFELMTDVFGNYVIQKYFEHGSAVQQLVLLELMMGHIYELSLQMYGCRVVQRALEAIDLQGQIRVVDELREYVLVCAKDQNGNHVIQKLIERIPFEHTKFILDALSNQIYHLSTHPYGCRVIQRLLEYSDPADQEMILDELHRFIYYLIQDQYGNYVMQHIIERGDPKDRELILVVVLGSVVNFSKHKFALNVIEKCIKYGLAEQRKRILHEVMLGNEDLEQDSVADDSPLALMMKDQYANYVIQKLVEVFDAKSAEKRLLVIKLRQYLKHISLKNSYGKHLASVEKMIVVAETALGDS